MGKIMDRFIVKMLFLIFVLTFGNFAFAQEESEASTEAVALSQSETFQQSVAQNKDIVGSNLPPHSTLWGSATKGLIYCLGIFLVFLAFKHKLNLKNNNNPDNPIHILAKKAVGARTNLILVEVESKKFLVAHNYDSLHLISEIIDDGYLTAAVDANVDTK
jgi:flagellar biogenesis protein FliO